MAGSVASDRLMIDVKPDEVWEDVRSSFSSFDHPAGLLRFPADANIASICGALWRDGAVVIERACTESACDDLIQQMTPYLDDAEFGDGFLGAQTRRCSAVVSRSPASWQFIGHPTLMKVCEGVLGRQALQCDKSDFKSHVTGARQLPWQLSLSQVICIGSGNAAQVPHRDGHGFLLDFSAFSKLDVEISTVWALQDFTKENGATRVLPGSHRWSRQQHVDPNQMEQATMPKGSVVIYLGNTVHSGGENRTEALRYGLNIDYNLSVLRQEENMYLSCPPSVAQHMPDWLQKLAGYSMAAASLGYFGEYQSPQEALKSNGRAGSLNKAINWASLHLPEFATSSISKL